MIQKAIDIYKYMKSVLLFFFFLINLFLANTTELKVELHNVNSENTTTFSLPAISFLVIRDGDVYWSYALGFGDLECKSQNIVQ